MTEKRILVSHVKNAELDTDNVEIYRFPAIKRVLTWESLVEIGDQKENVGLFRTQ
jgi:hypothetical protein